MSTALTTDTKHTDDVLHIDSFRLENILRLRMVDEKLEGESVTIYGDNGVGKSSTIDALEMALGFKPRNGTPEEPIRSGASKAETRVKLRNLAGEIAFVVDRVYTAKGMRLKVTAGDGTQVAPKTHGMTATELLESFKDSIGHTPFAWLEKRDQDQVDDVLRVCGVEPPVDRVTEILGEHFPPANNESASRYLERLSADETGIVYVRRREAGRVLDQKQKALREFRPVVDAGPDVEADISGLLDERKELDQKREQRRAVLATAQQAKTTYEEKRKKLDAILVQQESELRRIEDLEKQLAAAKAAAIETARIVKLGNERVPELKREWEAAQFAADHLADPSADIAAIDRQIQDADRNRQAIAARKQARETSDRLAVEADQAEKALAMLEMQLEAMRELRRNLLNEVDLGVAGLEIGEGALRLNGVTFRQASQAERIDVACALEFRRKPRLRVVWIDDAEHMSKRNREVIVRRAREAQWQCIMGVVRDDQKELSFEVVAETA